MIFERDLIGIRSRMLSLLLLLLLLLELEVYWRLLEQSVSPHGRGSTG